MKPLKEIKKEYKEFMDSIPDNIKKLKSFLGKDLFHYTLDEINRVQMFYEENYKTPHKLNLSEEDMDKMLAAYFGTAHLWHFFWNWCLETNKSADKYGVACIEKYGGKNYPSIRISPFDWVHIIKTNQLEEPLNKMYERSINYHKKRPEFILEPMRNIQ